MTMRNDLDDGNAEDDEDDQSYTYLNSNDSPLLEGLVSGGDVSLSQLSSYSTNSRASVPTADSHSAVDSRRSAPSPDEASSVIDIDGPLSSLSTFQSTSQSTPSLEELLGISSIEDDAAIALAIEEANSHLWKSESHVFCDPLQSQYAYRFLWGFIYGAGQKIHRYVSDESLLLCSSCVLSYSEIRNIFITALGDVYDQSGVDNLNEELLKWDLTRIHDGIKCAPSLISGSAKTGPIDSRIFFNSFFELILNADTLMPSVTSSADCKSLIDRILATCQQLSMSDIKQATQKLISTHQDTFPAKLLHCWIHSEEVISGLAKKATLSMSAEDLNYHHNIAMSSQSSSHQFEIVLLNWSAELKSLINASDIDAPIVVVPGPKLSLDSSMIQKNNDVWKRIHLITTTLYEIFNSSILRVGECHATSLFQFTESFLNLTQSKSSVPIEVSCRALKLVQLFCTQWTPDCPIFYIEVKDQPVNESSSCLITKWITLFQDVWISSKDETFLIVALRTFRELLNLMCREILLRTSMDLTTGRRLLTNLFELCFFRQATPNNSSPSGTGSAQRQELQHVKRQLLFLIIAVDAQFYTPEETSTEGESQPLILKHKIKLLPALTKVLQSGVLLEDREMERTIIFSFEKLFDWALADFKFELTVIQTKQLNFCHYLSILKGSSDGMLSVEMGVPTTSELSPRSAFLFGLLSKFVSTFYTHSEFGEEILCTRLRHLADFGLTGLALDPLLEISDIKNPNATLLDLLKTNGESGDKDGIKNKMESFYSALIRFNHVIQIIMGIGIFAMQCVIDRLLALVSTEKTSPNENSQLKQNYWPKETPTASEVPLVDGHVALPIVPSLNVPGRTDDPIDIAGWDCQSQRNHHHALTLDSVTLDSIFENPLVTVTHRLLSVIFCGRSNSIVLERCRILANLLAAGSTDNTSSLTTNSCSPLKYSVILQRPSDQQASFEVGTSTDIKFCSAISHMLTMGQPIQRITILESLEFVAEVLMETNQLQLDVEKSYFKSFQNSASNSYRRDQLLGAPTMSARWIGYITMILPALEKVGQYLIDNEGADTNEEAEKYAEITATIWRTIVLVLNFGPLRLDEATENPHSLSSQIFHPQTISSLLLSFLNQWMGCASRLLVLVAGQEMTFRPGTPPATVSVHVEAFTRHPNWVPRLLNWCTIEQAMIAELTLNECSSLEMVSQRWKMSAMCQLIQNLCSGVAKCMSIVHRSYQQKLERGSNLMPLLGRGELVPALEEEINARLKAKRKSVVSEKEVIEIERKSSSETSTTVTSASSVVKASTVAVTNQTQVKRKTLLDFLKFEESPSESERMTTFRASTNESKTTCQGKSAALLRRLVSKRSAFDSVYRKKRPFHDPAQKVGGRIPSSLSRKLGNDTGPKINLRVPSRLPQATTSRNSEKSMLPTLGAAKVAKVTKPTSEVVVSNPSLNSTGKPSTILAPALPSSRPKVADRLHRTIQVNDPQNQRRPVGEFGGAFGQKMDPAMKKIATEKAQAGLQEMLRDILEWDVFNLSSLELPQLTGLPERLPLTFESSEDFQRCFQPLVLEECRCSIIQGSAERKLIGFPIRITRITRLSNDLLGTAKSDKAAAGQALIENQVTDKDLDCMQLQPWDLILLTPRTPDQKDGNVIVGTNKDPDNGCEGRIFADLKEPPHCGYALAVVEKDEDKEAIQWGTRKIVTAKIRMPFRPPTHLRRAPSSRITINSFWTAYVIGSLTTSVREFQSLFMSRFCPLFPLILNPKKFGCRKASSMPTGHASPELEMGPMPAWLAGVLPILRDRCTLNESQLTGLKYALTVKHGVALLQGPPGTGKTKTLLAILAAIYHKASRAKGEVGGLKKKILVCAPSNAAVDEIAARVLKEGFPRLDEAGGVAFPNCVRVGNPKRITRPEVVEISLEESLQKASKENDKSQKDDFFSKREEISSKLDTLDLEMAALDSMRQAERVQNAFSNEPNDRSMARKFDELVKQKRGLHQQKVRLKEDFDKSWKTSKATTRDSLLRDADIVFATLSSSAAELLTSIEVDCVITDEAAQAVELSALIPLRLEPLRLVLIGDPQQLPATVLSKVARKFSYERSLFQRLQACGVGVKMLLMQYRMRPEISAFPSAHFYQSRLQNAPSVLNRSPLRMHAWSNLFRPFLFFNVLSTESRDAVSQSVANKGEAFFVVSLVRLLTKHFIEASPPAAQPAPNSKDGKSSISDPNRMTLSDVAVVTPYRQQIIELRRLFQAYPTEFPPDQPEVCTIDAFQGREKRIIIFSCVRSSGPVRSQVSSVDDESSISSSEDEDSERSKNQQENQSMNSKQDSELSTLGFVADVRRLNVAVTRARDCLWVVGNVHTLKTDVTWRTLIKYARGKGKIVHEKSGSNDLLPSSKGKVRTRRALVDVCSETQRLRLHLRPVERRVVIDYANPSIVVSTFFQFSEEFYLKQEQRQRQHEHLPKSAGPTATDLLLNTIQGSRRAQGSSPQPSDDVNHSVMTPSKSNNSVHDKTPKAFASLPKLVENLGVAMPNLAQQNAAKLRSLSNCSSITSSSNELSDGEISTKKRSVKPKPHAAKGHQMICTKSTSERKPSVGTQSMARPQMKSTIAVHKLGAVSTDKKRPREIAQIDEPNIEKKVCRPGGLIDISARRSTVQTRPFLIRPQLQPRPAPSATKTTRPRNIEYHQPPMPPLSSNTLMAVSRSSNIISNKARPVVDITDIPSSTSSVSSVSSASVRLSSNISYKENSQMRTYPISLRPCGLPCNDTSNHSNNHQTHPISLLNSVRPSTAIPSTVPPHKRLPPGHQPLRPPLPVQGNPFVPPKRPRFPSS